CHCLHCFLLFFSDPPAATDIYTLSLHDALPISNPMKKAPKLAPFVLSDLDRPCSLFQPRLYLWLFNQWHQLFTCLGVIIVQPIVFFLREKLGYNKAQINWAPCECLEREHLSVTALDLRRFFHIDKVLDANAILAWAIISWLIGEDHARQNFLHGLTSNT